ncbi:peptidoglycan-binding protein [Streptomyces sp. NPDC048623]|uniref:peptidoglycan-binding protein n=1 Tax=Streptomyces sp. NPDC048623 TaxID=3155761 RepID=UPI00343F8433
MKRNLTRFKLGAGLVGALAATVLAMGTTPAAAAGDYSGLPYIAGGYDYWDDWGDEGVLSVSQHAASNATCLWQKILWADSYINDTEVDGYFGSTTQYFTGRWQGDRHLVPADGAVGKDTFSRADANIKWVSGGLADGQKLELVYDGVWHDFAMIRDENGIYAFQDYTGQWRNAGYDYRSCFKL